MGAALILCYGLLGAFRKEIPHCRAAVACEDLVYWMLTGVAVFAVVYRSNQGILRNFLFLGVVFGAWLCHATIYPVVEKILQIVFRIPTFFVKFLIKRLLFPVRRCKIFLSKFINYRKRRKWLPIKRTKRSRQVEKGKKRDKKS